MSDNFFRAVGLGILIESGCFGNLLRGLIGLLIILVGFSAVVAVYQGASNAISYGTLDDRAVSTIESQRKAQRENTFWATAAVQDASGVAAFITKAQALGSINVGVRRDVWYHGKGYYLVEYVKFGSDRFLVFVDLDVQDGGAHERSCIRYPVSYWSTAVWKPIENRFTQLSNSHFKGYQAYSYSEMSFNVKYKFSPDCDDTESTQIPLFQSNAELLGR
ncbi:MAG: hypothetical protein HZB53_11045 [Chloroflexi bacterium]|nr:hypothetical protein [Chloroflexota bacterium]